LVDEVETVQPTLRTAKAGMSIVKEDVAIVYYATVLSIFKTGAVPKKISRSKKAKVEEEEVIEEVAGTEEEEKAANCHKCGQSAHPDPI
jgi:hypothetical protein